MKHLILIALCIYSTYSYSASPEYTRCIKEGVKFDYTCAKVEYEHHSKRLKNALAALLNLRNVNKQDLLNQQDKWIKYRDKTCPKNTGVTTTDWQSCVARLTKSRANEVEKIIKKH
ncbi:lysozyme inhibitor LprI family protein [Crenothrix sp.]|uniref:lysozyme inhibitor LprI family protein n=1 Tax=Crenothrix sp. TaxID=3100433 RepID=UPI00374DEDBB